MLARPRFLLVVGLLCRLSLQLEKADPLATSCLLFAPDPQQQLRQTNKFDHRAGGKMDLASD